MSKPGAANRHALKLDINGAGEVRTLVDTGATGVIVTESIARAAKLERLGPNLLLGLGDQGVREGWFARAATLSAQGLVFEDCVVEVIPDDVRENMSTPALMGLDGLYRDFAIRFDFAGGELDSAMWALRRTLVTVECWPDKDAVVSSANPRYSASILINSWKPISGSVGDVAEVDVTFPVSGGWNRYTTT